MDNHEHNGYHNYSTFLVCLWLENGRKRGEAARIIVSQLVPQDAAPDAEEWGTAAQAIREWIETQLWGVRHVLAGDLMNSGLTEVDWLEVAVNALDEKDRRVLRRPRKASDKYTITIDLGNRALWDGGEVSTQGVAGVLRRLSDLWGDSDFVQSAGPVYNADGIEVARTEYLR